MPDFRAARSSIDDDLNEFPGETLGAGVSVIVVSIDQEGGGPALHRHPYTETFVVRAGRAQFTVGADTFIGTAGDILVVPPLTPHAFAKTGPDRLEMVDIHESPRFITEWL
jgi:mannose-6-phosphate isomerase-like protein (cupin superfamily)